MALKGTIQDFGIADIFQLIGHQTKTGVLVLRDRDDEVKIFFSSGSVVRADESSRPRNELLGTLLREAEVISSADLEAALQEQQETLKKLGTILVERELITAEELRQFARLQMTETIFRLFAWTAGTYEFEQMDSAPPAEGADPIRAEVILMEGVRMIDEWPGIQARLPSYDAVPEKVKPLPELVSGPSSADIDLDVFGFDADAPQQRKPSVSGDIGPSEHRVYELIETGRSVQKLIYLSRLGEFETCRALLNLESAGHVRIVRRTLKGPGLDRTTAAWSTAPKGGLVLRLAAYATLALLLVVIAGVAGVAAPARSLLRYEAPVTQRYLAVAQMKVIDRALAVYQLSHGRYPESLAELGGERLLRERDLRFPFGEPYFYRVEGEHYLLLPPVR